MNITYEVIDPSFSSKCKINIKECKKIEDFKRLLAENLLLDENQFKIINLPKKLKLIKEEIVFKLEITNRCNDITFLFPNGKEHIIPNCYQMSKRNVTDYFEKFDIYYSQRYIRKYLLFLISDKEILKIDKPFFAVSEGSKVEVKHRGKTIKLEYNDKEFILAEDEKASEAYGIIFSAFDQKFTHESIFITKEGSNSRIEGKTPLKSDEKYNVDIKYRFTFRNISNKNEIRPIEMSYLSTVSDSQKKLSDGTKKVAIYGFNRRNLLNAEDRLIDIKNFANGIYFSIYDEEPKENENNSTTAKNQRSKREANQPKSIERRKLENQNDKDEYKHKSNQKGKSKNQYDEDEENDDQKNSRKESESPKSKRKNGSQRSNQKEKTRNRYDEENDDDRIDSRKKSENNKLKRDENNKKKKAGNHYAEDEENDDQSNSRKKSESQKSNQKENLRNKYDDDDQIDSRKESENNKKNHQRRKASDQNGEDDGQSNSRKESENKKIKREEKEPKSKQRRKEKNPYDEEDEDEESDSSKESEHKEKLNKNNEGDEDERLNVEKPVRNRHSPKTKREGSGKNESEDDKNNYPIEKSEEKESRKNSKKRENDSKKDDEEFHNDAKYEKTNDKNKEKSKDGHYDKTESEQDTAIDETEEDEEFIPKKVIKVPKVKQSPKKKPVKSDDDFEKERRKLLEKQKGKQLDKSPNYRIEQEDYNLDEEDEKPRKQAKVSKETAKPTKQIKASKSNRNDKAESENQVKSKRKQSKGDHESARIDKDKSDSDKRHPTKPIVNKEEEGISKENHIPTSKKETKTKPEKPVNSISNRNYDEVGGRAEHQRNKNLAAKKNDESESSTKTPKNKDKKDLELKQKRRSEEYQSEDKRKSETESTSSETRQTTKRNKGIKKPPIPSDDGKSSLKTPEPSVNSSSQTDKDHDTSSSTIKPRKKSKKIKPPTIVPLPEENLSSSDQKDSEEKPKLEPKPIKPENEVSEQKQNENERMIKIKFIFDKDNEKKYSSFNMKMHPNTTFKEIEEMISQKKGITDKITLSYKYKDRFADILSPELEISEMESEISQTKESGATDNILYVKITKPTKKSKKSTSISESNNSNTQNESTSKDEAENGHYESSRKQEQSSQEISESAHTKSRIRSSNSPSKIEKKKSSKSSREKESKGGDHANDEPLTDTENDQHNPSRTHGQTALETTDKKRRGSHHSHPNSPSKSESKKSSISSREKESKGCDHANDEPLTDTENDQHNPSRTHGQTALETTDKKRRGSHHSHPNSPSKSDSKKSSKSSREDDTKGGNHANDEALIGTGRKKSEQGKSMKHAERPPKSQRPQNYGAQKHEGKDDAKGASNDKLFHKFDKSMNSSKSSNKSAKDFSRTFSKVIRPQKGKENETPHSKRKPSEELKNNESGKENPETKDERKQELVDENGESKNDSGTQVVGNSSKKEKKGKNRPENTKNNETKADDSASYKQSNDEGKDEKKARSNDRKGEIFGLSAENAIKNEEMQEKLSQSHRPHSGRQRIKIKSYKPKIRPLKSPTPSSDQISSESHTKQKNEKETISNSEKPESAADDDPLITYNCQKNGSDETFKVKLRESGKVGEMKELISKMNGVPNINNIKILFAGKNLVDDLVVSDLEVGEATLFVYIRSEEDIFLMTANALKVHPNNSGDEYEYEYQYIEEEEEDVD